MAYKIVDSWIGVNGEWESGENQMEERMNKIKNYYDADGKLKQYPSKRPLRALTLAGIAKKFQADTDYTEKEVNEIIRGSIAFSDIELIRREMIEAGFLGRTKDGSKYWRENMEITEHGGDE